VRASLGVVIVAVLGVGGLSSPAVAASPTPSASAVPLIAPAPDAAGAASVTVMTRNLYLGADVGVALDKLPDLPAAAQFMWDQVAATDFTARVPALAGEVAQARPDVIGVQEATQWTCRKGLTGASVVVYDFTKQFLDATAAAGVPYVVARKDGAEAINPGFAIPAVPYVTMVRDPDTFRPLFGADRVACGFTIADALLVRADLADRVEAVGTTEFEQTYPIVPVAFEIGRGYSWADLRLDSGRVRFVTTHLESMYTAGKRTPSAVQAEQLVADLSRTTLPVVVMGDLNTDPRDPRAAGAPNPGSQPVVSDVCPGQPPSPTVATSRAECSAYWTLRKAGYADAGPDATDGRNLTWGANALLAGPDSTRVDASLAMGNRAGFTDRLDYVMVRNGASATSARVIGNEWPVGSRTWACDSAEQVAATEEMSARLAAAGYGPAVTGRGVCLPTDHAGLVVTIALAATPADADATPPPTHRHWLTTGRALLGALALLLVLVVWWVVRRRRRRARRAAAAAAADPVAAAPDRD
jgi:hypothetical protein